MLRNGTDGVHWIDAQPAALERHLEAEVLPAYRALAQAEDRSEEHTSELQSLMRISYAVFCLKKQTTQPTHTDPRAHTHKRITTNLRSHLRKSTLQSPQTY